MNTKWRQTLISVVISLLLISGGATITVLLVILTNGGGFPYGDLNRYMIVIITSVSFIMPGIFSFISSLRGVKSRMYGFHISMETLFLFLAVTAFINFRNSIQTYSIAECTEIKSNGTCICGELKSVFETCGDVNSYRTMTYVTMVLYLVTWFVVAADLVRSMCISCCLQEEDIPGVVIDGKQIETITSMRTV